MKSRSPPSASAWACIGVSRSIGSSGKEEARRVTGVTAWLVWRSCDTHA
jgi:hypothetical protein